MLFASRSFLILAVALMAEGHRYPFESGFGTGIDRGRVCLMDLTNPAVRREPPPDWILHPWAYSWTLPGAPPIHPARVPASLRARLMTFLPEGMRPLFQGHDSLFIDPETLWLARCIYSESDQPHEQEVVAWVVRNRVAAGYQGEVTYREVVLAPRQFSAFNRDAPRRAFYLSLMPDRGGEPWQRALAIAHYVRHAPPEKSPFTPDVMHFYSEVSMKGRRHPAWAVGRRPSAIAGRRVVDPLRFRFFALNEE